MSDHIEQSVGRAADYARGVTRGTAIGLEAAADELAEITSIADAHDAAARLRERAEQLRAQPEPTLIAVAEAIAEDDGQGPPDAFRNGAERFAASILAASAGYGYMNAHGLHAITDLASGRIVLTFLSVAQLAAHCQIKHDQ